VLDNAQGRVLAHRDDKPQHRRGRHFGIGVQNQHQFEAVRVMVQEVHDVAGLEAGIVGSPPVVDATGIGVGRAERGDRPLFRLGRVAGVGQHEQGERVAHSHRVEDHPAAGVQAAKPGPWPRCVPSGRWRCAAVLPRPSPPEAGPAENSRRTKPIRPLAAQNPTQGAAPRQLNSIAILAAVQPPGANVSNIATPRPTHTHTTIAITTRTRTGIPVRTRDGTRTNEEARAAGIGRL